MKEAVYSWNATPVDIDIFPERLWDFKDMQFMRGIKYARKRHNYSYLLKADKFAKALNNFTLVDADSISQAKEIGTPWDHEGNITLSADQTLNVDLKRVSKEKAIEISLDNNDNYAIVYFLEKSAYYMQLLDRKPFPPNMGGLNIYEVEVPDKVRDKGFDKIGILPVSGDGRYSIGHLNFLETKITWGDGFYALEHNDTLEWRWCIGTGYLTINNYTEHEKRVSIKMDINYYPEIKQRNLTISSDSFNEYIDFNGNNSAEFLKDITIPSNNAIKIIFQADGKPVTPPNDPRYIVFSVSNFKYEERRYK